MKKSLSPTKIKTRKTIIDNAQKLFLEKGYHGTEVGDIAKLSGIDKRTIYRYFDSKDALAFAVWKDVIAKVMDVGLDAEGNTGYEKIEYLFSEYINKFEENKNIIRFLGEFDHVFASQYPVLDEAEDFVSYIKNRDNEILKYLKEGVGDKSIDKDIDISLTAATISNILMSLSQRIVIRGEHLKIEQGYSTELMSQAVKLMLRAIKAK